MSNSFPDFPLEYTWLKENFMWVKERRFPSGILGLVGQKKGLEPEARSWAYLLLGPSGSVRTNAEINLATSWGSAAAAADYKESENTWGVRNCGCIAPLKYSWMDILESTRTWLASKPAVREPDMTAKNRAENLLLRWKNGMQVPDEVLHTTREVLREMNWQVDVPENTFLKALDGIPRWVCDPVRKEHIHSFFVWYHNGNPEPEKSEAPANPLKPAWDTWAKRFNDHRCKFLWPIVSQLGTAHKSYYAARLLECTFSDGTLEDYKSRLFGRNGFFTHYAASTVLLEKGPDAQAALPEEKKIHVLSPEQILKDVCGFFQESYGVNAPEQLLDAMKGVLKLPPFFAKSSTIPGKHPYLRIVNPVFDASNCRWTVEAAEVVWDSNYRDGLAPVQEGVQWLMDNTDVLKATIGLGTLATLIDNQA